MTVGFGQASYTVAEGGTVEVAVSLSAAHQGVRGVTAPVVTAAATTAEAHEFGVPASVTFAAGERTKRFMLTVNQDAIDDDDEFVQLGFGALPGGVSAGATSETRVSHHRRRRSSGDGQLRLGHLRRGRGKQRERCREPR